ncbi:NTF2 and RRM domain-containing protein [Phlyctema vagabunda]|uniref:NTF2 and RRM domain-containing protein n=1 Tax=Phlyctema vagabunda TaxID=108571 RepID=A0ABR4PPH5_9HELO
MASNTNGSFANQEQYTATADSNTANATGVDLSKDEVGWYFVEQYYTTLSKSPEKLHLFYGKRSQFVSGPEAESVPVSVGRAAIQERIRDLDFQDCKVRVSNVDSQASFDNIVIQVIGETSNKSAELKKFVQTFVLAQQPSGYFVLNDIFRYINEEAEEEVEAAQEETGPLVEDVEMPKAQAATEETSTLDAAVVDQKLEETIETETAAPATNGAEAPEPEVEETPAPAAKEESVTPEAAEKEVEEETIKEVETPKEPAVTPAISRLPSTTKEAAAPAPEKPAAQPKPMSWASRAAAAVVATPKPAVPAAAKAPAATAAAPRATPAATQAKPAQAAPAETTAPKDDKDKENAGWQSVGNDAKRQNRPQSISAPPEKEGTMGYVKFVTEKVGDSELRAALSSFGELIYFDINRSKNCAFVEYKEPAGYQAAAAANPHKVSGEDIYVEPRRPKAGAYGGNGYNGGRGGIANRGRGGFEQGRGPPSQGRGNFGGQNRGRGGAPRGARGASQAANA